jgi:hypothetical protein
VVEELDEYGLILSRAKEITATPQRKFIEGLRY